jgi:translation initiation factor IF-3
LIGEGGEQLGVLPLNQALQIARERNADLVEVAPTAVPPVCRLLDYGRFKYEQTKREREARKNQKVVLLKEVRLRPKIDDHDVNFKTKLIEKFLSEGDKVKITVVFRGRELAHPQLGKELLDSIANALKGKVTVEKAPSMEGRNMTMILAGAASKRSAPASTAVAQ